MVNLERTRDPAEYVTDWASPPGDTIMDIMAERGISHGILGEVLQLHTPLDIEALLVGDMEITPVLASRLSSLLGGSLDFWLRRDRKYREDLARVLQT